MQCNTCTACKHGTAGSRSDSRWPHAVRRQIGRDPWRIITIVRTMRACSLTMEVALSGLQRPSASKGPPGSSFQGPCPPSPSLSLASQAQGQEPAGRPIHHDKSLIPIHASKHSAALHPISLFGNTGMGRHLGLHCMYIWFNSSPRHAAWSPCPNPP